ncbi:MAG TPA: hypothetical protein VD772_08820, partial [Anseongella sp.]|nr:hypothetical protein [Anseongella sp.]
MKKPVNTAFRCALPVMICLGLAVSCNNPKQGNNQEESAEPDTSMAMESQPSTLSQVWKTDSTLTGSESTLYDAEKDIIY